MVNYFFCSEKCQNIKVEVTVCIDYGGVWGSFCNVETEVEPQLNARIHILNAEMFNP